MANPIAVHISDIVMMPVSELKPHPKNPNSHSKEQIKRLAQILSYQGWRYPIKVSKLSGYITSGHGRLEAARFLGLDEVPVSFQDYADTDQEYADIVADNAIASWSELDFSAINLEIEHFSPDFDIDLLGIQNFKLDPAEIEAKPIDVPIEYIVSVECRSETEMQAIFEELKERGFQCRLIT